MKMKNIQRKGITIVTLVITVVILTVLTGAVMLTTNNSDIFGQTQTTIDEHNKQAMIEQIQMKIQKERLGKINRGETGFTIKEDVIPVVKNFGTYEEDTLKLTTTNEIEIYLYEILDIHVEEYVTAVYKDKVFTITEKEDSLSSNGYKYEYTYDNGIVWQAYTAPVTIQEQSGIKVRLVNSEGQVISNEYVVTKGAGEETVNKIKQIAITNAPTKTTYVQGQTFSPTGMEITVTYEDNTKKVVTNYNYTPTRALTVSDRYITISYTENGVTKQATQSITVTNKLTAIGITELKKTKYKQGETINKSDIVVKATYEDNTNKQVTNFTYEPTRALQSTDTSITVTYTEDGVTQTTSEPIQVTYITALEITSEPSVEFKTTYIKGENFDTTGLIVSVIYADRNALPVTNYEIVNGTNLQVGTNEIVIRYTEGGITLEKEIPITVTNNVTGIVVTTPPNKTTYNHNETFDKAGMTVTVNYQNKDDSRPLQESEYTVSTPTYGQNYVTITHTETGMTTTQAITVNRVLASIEITNEQDKTVYVIGETFDTTGMIVKATYTDSEIPVEITGYTSSPSTALTISDTTVTITYNGKSDTIDIYVVPNTNWNVASLNQEKPYVTETIGETIYYAPVPLGFTVALGTISEGLVIQDASGNQFVWVPVNDEYKMVADAFDDGYAHTEQSVVPCKTDIPYIDSVSSNITALDYWKGAVSGLSGYVDFDGTRLYFTEPDNYAASWEIESYDQMISCVINYGGFYVGRFETSGSTATPTVIADAIPITNVPWCGSDYNIGTSTAVSTSLDMYTTTEYGVKSTLIYGIQWDSIMSWAGCYNATRSQSGNLSNSGSVPSDCYKNIYDLVGNAQEWTMENKYWAYDNGGAYRVVRGGRYLGNLYTMGTRDHGEMATGYAYVGFRIALYLK